MSNQRQPPSDFTPLTYEELMEELPPVNYLCEDIDFSPGRPCMIVGMGGGGKSIAMQSFIVATIAGLPLWDKFNTRQGRAVHLDYEMGRRPTVRRYRRLCAGAGVRWEDVGRDLTLCPMPELFLSSEGVVDAIKRLVDGAALCFIDSLRRAAPGADENSSAMSNLIDPLTRVSQDTQTVFVIAHHASTKTKEGPQDSRAFGRGSSAILDSAGSQLNFSGKKGEPVNVEHVRAFESGRFADPFLLEFADVAANGDPRGGLLVTYKDQTEEPVDKAADRLANYAACKAEVARLCASRDIRGLNELMVALGSYTAAVVKSVIADLQADGATPQLKRVGNRWRVV